MREFVVLFCLFASGLGFVLEPQALERLSEESSLLPSNRIVGGRETDIRDVPYQVYLEYNKHWFCGGVLVSEYFVLTVAKCVFLGDTSLTVRVGSSKRNSGGTVLGIEYLHVHDDFYATKMDDYDIAVIRLKEKAPLGESVKPVRVADTEAKTGTVLTVSGWGSLSERGDPSEDLYSVEVNTIPKEECRKIYSDFRNVTDRMMCTYTPGKDSCYGDNGGPAVSKGVVYGLVGWGIGCARPNSPKVYTNLANPSIREFIRNYAEV